LQVWFAAEDEAAAFARLPGGVVDLLPAATEVVDGGDDETMVIQ
jgi:hypothetical protein